MKFLQFNGSDIPMLVEAETIPIHPDQYQVDDDTDFSAISGKVYSGGSFYPPKIVADTAQDGIAVTLGEKVTG